MQNDPHLVIAAAWEPVVDQVDEIDNKLQVVAPRLVLDELLELRNRLDHLLQLLRT